MNNRGLVEKAIRLAAFWHDGQPDAVGEPYILHPLRVMNYVWRDLSGEDYPDKEFLYKAMTVAMLHDVMEDTGVGARTLKSKGFPDDVIKAVELLTHGDEPYLQYIETIKTMARHEDEKIKYVGRLARRVKIADLTDNTDPQRTALLKKMQPEKYERLQAKYRKAKLILTEE